MSPWIIAILIIIVLFAYFDAYLGGDSSLIYRFFKLISHKQFWKQLICRHKWVQFGKEEEDSIDPNINLVFCKKCNKGGYLKEKFMKSIE